MNISDTNSRSMLVKRTGPAREALVEMVIVLAAQDVHPVVWRMVFDPQDLRSLSLGP